MFKIEINVIWQKQFKDGPQVAAIIFEYFCSGFVCPLKDVALGIPVLCNQIDNIGDFKINHSASDILYADVILAEKNMAGHDGDGYVINTVKREADEKANVILIPISLDEAGKKYIGSFQRGFKFEGDEPDMAAALKARVDSIETAGVKENLPYILRDILNATVNRYYNLVLGKNGTKLGVFISHTKSTENSKTILTEVQGKLLSAIKEFDCFVDRTSIGMGEDFEKSIYRNATTRAMILLLTDNFSARDWCQREIFYAKKFLMPIIIIDLIEKKDERLFSYIGNVPIIKYNGKNIGEIYELLAWEVLFCLYNRFKYDYGKNVKVLCRKIELLDIVAMDFSNKSEKKTLIIYPDPPICWTEKKIIENAASHYNVKVQTPITRLLDKYSVNKCNVLISSSKDKLDYIDGTCCIGGIDYAVKEITRYLIFNGFTIVNGGYFKQGGMNDLIIKEIEHYKKIITWKKVYGICYVDAYTYKNDKENIDSMFDKHVYISSRRGRKYTDYIRIELPPESEMTLSKDEQLYLNRVRIVGNSQAHIVIGGNTDSENTGISREVELSVQNGNPIYLLGGYGYQSKLLCEKYISKQNYEKLNNGLDFEENVALSWEKDIDTILNLIFTGLSRLQKKL